MAKRKGKRNRIQNMGLQHNTDQQTPQARVVRRREGSGPSPAREYRTLTGASRRRVARAIETATITHEGATIACLALNDELWVAVVL